MSEHSDPERLFESADAPPQLRSLLARAHEDVPSPAERALLIKGALEGGTAGWHAAPGRFGGGVRWAGRLARHSTKILAMAAVVGVGAGGVYVVGARDRQTARTAPPPQPTAEPYQVVSVAAPPGETANAGEERDNDGSAIAAQAPAPRAIAPESPALRPHASRGARRGLAANDAWARTRHNQPARLSAQLVSAPSPVAPARPEASAPELASPPRQDNPVQPVPEASVEPARPEAEPRAPASGTEEATLLRSARQALARSPERALSLTEDHLRLFPHGILDQEREALAIEALIKLGRIVKARTRAHDFERTYRDSPHRTRIERAFKGVPGGLAPP